MAELDVMSLSLPCTPIMTSPSDSLFQFNFDVECVKRSLSLSITENNNDTIDNMDSITDEWDLVPFDSDIESNDDSILQDDNALDQAFMDADYDDSWSDYSDDCDDDDILDGYFEMEEAWFSSLSTTILNNGFRRKKLPRHARDAVSLRIYRKQRQGQKVDSHRAFKHQVRKEARRQEMNALYAKMSKNSVSSYQAFGNHRSASSAAPISNHGQPQHQHNYHSNPPTNDRVRERDLDPVSRRFAMLQRHVASQRDRLLAELQYRELTPEDYELLLELDASIAPKTVDAQTLSGLKTIPGSDLIGLEDHSCMVCMESIEVTQEACQLKCKHVFHYDCIKTWLSTYAQTCPVDNLPAETL